MLDPDTFLSPGSIDATLRGSGAACFAIDQVLGGKARMRSAPRGLRAITPKPALRWAFAC